MYSEGEEIRVGVAMTDRRRDCRRLWSFEAGLLSLMLHLWSYISGPTSLVFVSGFLFLVFNRAVSLALYPGSCIQALDSRYQVLNSMNIEIIYLTGRVRVELSII